MDNKAWAQEVAKKIKKKEIEVIKRSVNKVPYIAKNGVFDDLSETRLGWWTNGFWGGMTLDFISRLKPDIAFVGAVGVDVKENSVSTYDIDDGINKAAIIRHSKKAYVVAEARKLSTDGNYNYTTLDTLSGLITDTLPARDIQDAADSYGVEIILP